jgi:micrococcal nuclease
MKIEYKATIIEPLSELNPNIFTYYAQVKNIIDGDTIDVMVDLGFKTYVLKRLRLARINCPEKHTVNGLKAKEAVEELLPIDSIIIFRSTRLDKYGRSVAEIYYNIHKTPRLNLSDELVNKAFAVFQSY